MAYNIRIKRAARRKLQSLPTRDRFRVTDAISSLGRNPDDPELDTRQLTGSRLWRLRIGRWRVIFDRDDDIRVISIKKVGGRGDIYK